MSEVSHGGSETQTTRLERIVRRDGRPQVYDETLLLLQARIQYQVRVEGRLAALEEGGRIPDP